MAKGDKGQWQGARVLKVHALHNLALAFFCAALIFVDSLVKVLAKEGVAWHQE